MGFLRRNCAYLAEFLKVACGNCDYVFTDAIGRRYKQNKFRARLLEYDELTDLDKSL